MYQLGIVHVGFPNIVEEGLPVFRAPHEVIGICHAIPRVKRWIVVQRRPDLLDRPNQNLGECSIEVPGELHPDWADRGEGGKPRGSHGGHLQADPSAKRGANQSAFRQPDLIQQIQVQVRQLLRPVDRRDAALPVEAWVLWHDDAPLLGEPLGNILRGLRALLAVQEEHSSHVAGLPVIVQRQHRVPGVDSLASRHARSFNNSRPGRPMLVAFQVCCYDRRHARW
jgi:hypothetical protein